MNEDPGFALVRVVLGMAVGGGIGYLIGRGKGRGGLGLILGAFLGCIGWIIVACIGPAHSGMVRRRTLPPRRPMRPMPGAPDAGGKVACPYCAEMIMPGARICRFCQSQL